MKHNLKWIMFSVSIIVLTVTSLLTYYFATHDLEKQPESDIKIKKKIYMLIELQV